MIRRVGLSCNASVVSSQSLDNLARKLLPNPEQQVKQNGSLMVCEADRSERLRQEFDFLQKLHCPCEWWDEERVIAVCIVDDFVITGVTSAIKAFKSEISKQWEMKI